MLRRRQGNLRPIPSLASLHTRLVVHPATSTNVLSGPSECAASDGDRLTPLYFLIQLQPVLRWLVYETLAPYQWSDTGHSLSIPGYFFVYVPIDGLMRWKRSRLVGHQLRTKNTADTTLGARYCVLDARRNGSQ